MSYCFLVTPVLCVPSAYGSCRCGGNFGGWPPQLISCYDIYRLKSSPDYESLANVRYQIRRFLHFSESAARAAGLEPHQHQLILALKGLPQGVRPRVRELAERLQIQHHSAVELASRLAARGYITRERAGGDRREVLLCLTPKGEKVLRELSIHHRAELREQGPILIAALTRAIEPRRRGNSRAKMNSNRRNH